MAPIAASAGCAEHGGGEVLVMVRAGAASDDGGRAEGALVGVGWSFGKFVECFNALCNAWLIIGHAWREFPMIGT